MNHYLIQTMRWFGPDDPVSLTDIRQAGCTEVVTALHHIPNGEVWPPEEIAKRKSMIRAAGLEWTVVESIPVHEDVKTRRGRFAVFVDNYKKSLRNCAAAGIRVVTYNFMPVLDWTRTDLAWELPGGAKALRFDATALAAFELFALERTGHGYQPSLVDAARNRWNGMSSPEREQLQQNIIAGLPGSEEHFTLDRFRSALAAYDGIGEKELRANLIAFLREITPVAAEAGIVLAIHPDDPPFPIFGLPRIVKSVADLDELFSAIGDEVNGLCFCTGSLGVREDNDLPAMVNRYGDRIHFLHLRNVQREPGGSFHEADHLGGSTDMAAVMQAVVQLQQRRKRSLPVRPDHGHQMLDDLSKKTNPGYSGIGRLKGLAELRGLELGVMHFLKGGGGLDKMTE